jgi:hypothetical protein
VTIESDETLAAAEQAGADYASAQVDGEYFRDWVAEQLAEAERMRQSDPDSVIPIDSPRAAREVAKNMLQQLKWDTHRDMDTDVILELSGAEGLTRSEIVRAFYRGFDAALQEPAIRNWLADLVLENVTSSESVVGETGRSQSAAMTPEQRAVIDTALRQYGAHLTDDDHIAHGEKVLSVRFEISKGRLRAVSNAGQLLASFPASKLASGVADFVEKFWYWKRTSGGEPVVSESTLPTDQQLIDYFIFDTDDADIGTFSRATTDEVAAHFKLDPKAAFRALDALAKRGVLSKTRDVMKRHRGQTAVGYQWWEYLWKPEDTARYEARQKPATDDRVRESRRRRPPPDYQSSSTAHAYNIEVFYRSEQSARKFEREVSRIIGQPLVSQGPMRDGYRMEYGPIDRADFRRLEGAIYQEVGNAGNVHLVQVMYGADRALAEQVSESPVTFQSGERLRIRNKGPGGQSFEAFWFTIPSPMTLDEVALQFAQTGQPGMFVEIGSGKLQWTFRIGRHAGQPSVTRVPRAPRART